jgi:hypothetical protein
MFASSAFAAPNITGQWSIHWNISGYSFDHECKLVQTANKISGTCKGESQEREVTGMLDGNKVTWQYDWEYSSTPLTLVYNATLDDSGKIAGSIEAQPQNASGDFTATPSKTAGK